MTTAATGSPASPSRQRPEKTFVWRVLALVVLPFMYAITRYRVIDGHKMPKTGAFVLAPNHYSEIDPVIMGIVMWRLGRVPRFLAKASLFRIPVVGAVLRATGQIPVDRAGATRTNDPLASARKLASDGHAVIIYPEGSLTRDPELWPMRGKSGAVRMALSAGVPIIPAAHWGTQKVMPRYAKKISVFPRKTIVSKIGDPVDLSAFAGRPLDTQTLTEATAVVMAAITALVEDIRNEKAPAARWDPTKNNQAETGRF